VTDERLQRDLLSAVQLLTNEIRELNRRINWIRPASPVQAEPTRPAPTDGKLRTVPLPRQRKRTTTETRDHPVKRGGGSHMVAGPTAAGRVRGLRGRLQISQAELASRLGCSNAMVGFIEGRQCGISHRMHEKLRAVEEGTDGRTEGSTDRQG
jgi:DNA-binding XRE family transcriptional regulator